MVTRIDDRWLWLGIGVFTFFAVKGVAHGLRTIVTLTEIHTPPPKPAIPSAAVRNEDAIKLSSLETLALCDNIEIRKASTRILCERFMSSHAACVLLWKDFDSRNPARMRRAEQALRLLEDYGVLHEHRVLDETVLREALMQRPRQRRSRNSTEERDLRRRRREAMVLNEGDRPISHEDVWMRDATGSIYPGLARDMATITADLRRVDAQVQALIRARQLAGDTASGDLLEDEGVSDTDDDADRLEREETPSPASLASSSGTDN